jgi:ABC-2 type transport system permease protein
MNLPTLRLEVRRSRMLIIWLSLIAALYSGLMAALFPVIRDNMAVYEEIMKIYPKEFMAAFGMTGSLADHGVFFTTYIGSFLWPLIAAIAGIIVATRTTAADVDRGWIEMPLAAPVSRLRYLAAAIVGQLIVLTVLAVVSVGGLLVVGVVVADGFDTARFLLVVPVALAFGCVIAAITTLAGTITLSRGIAGGLAAGLLIAMYLARIIAEVQPDMGWLAGFSLFDHFDPTPIIDEGTVPWNDLALLGGLAVAAWLGSLWVFARRDLVA